MRNIKLISLLALLLLLLVTVSPCCQAEGNYPIYESELTRLLQICERLDKLNNQLQSEQKNSKKESIQLQKELESCKEELTQLQSELQVSKAESNQLKSYLAAAVNSLQKAEESWKQYKKEVESKIRKLTIQRNVIAVIAAILGIIAL
jgi:peptidoglycan hydrolase CwlO-like protein